MAATAGSTGAASARAAVVRSRKPMPVAWFIPVLALLGLVTLYPTAFVIWMSFQKTSYFQLQGFVGLRNYATILGSGSFWEMARVSLVYLVGSLGLSLVLGVAAALVFNASGRIGAALRVLTLFPWTLSMAVVGSIWLWMLNPSFGPVTYFLGQAGISPGLMLGDPDVALPLTVLVTAWWSFPYVMVMVSAAIQSIPAELYEAIDIDGGGPSDKFRYVTLPHLVPTLGSTGLNLAIIYLTLVTLLIVLTGGGPLGATTTLSLEIFRGTLQSVDIGPAAVMSIMVLVINITLGAIYTRLTGRVTG